MYAKRRTEEGKEEAEELLIHVLLRKEQVKREKNKKEQTVDVIITCGLREGIKENEELFCTNHLQGGADYQVFTE